MANAVPEPWRYGNLTDLLNADELETELFVYMDTIDHVSMSNRGWDPADPNHQAVFGAFVRDFFRYASLVSSPPGRGVTGVYSTCNRHHTALVNTMTFGAARATTGGVVESINDVLHQWVADRPGTGSPSRSYNVHALTSSAGSDCPR